MLGEKFLHFVIAGSFQACGQIVICQIGLERIVTQGAGMAPVWSAIALGQGPLGFVVQLTLLLQTRSLGGFKGDDGEKQTQTNTGESTAHETSENGGEVREFLGLA